MTGRKEELAQRLQRDFDACDRHVLRIREALAGLSADVPLSAEVYEAFTPEQVRCVDQYLFRFAKLQDAMGAKIFRTLLEFWDEDVTNLPMRDILDRLERYRLLPSAEEWVYIRELRNELAHDYPVSDNDVVELLNELFIKTGVLFGIYEKIKQAYLKS